MTDISAVQALPSLKAFGFEGSIWTIQKVDSFQPISILPQLEALFLLACRPAKDGLRPLFEIRSLRHLEIAARYPDAEFLALQSASPQLACSWFRAIADFGSLKACLKAYRENKREE